MSNYGLVLCYAQLLGANLGVIFSRYCDLAWLLTFLLKKKWVLNLLAWWHSSEFICNAWTCYNPSLYTQKSKESRVVDAGVLTRIITVHHAPWLFSSAYYHGFYFGLGSPFLAMTSTLGQSCSLFLVMAALWLYVFLFNSRPTLGYIIFFLFHFFLLHKPTLFWLENWMVAWLWYQTLWPQSILNTVAVIHYT